MTPNQLRELAEALAHGTHFVDSPELHEAMTKAANVLRQCAEQRPDGWQLVPVEPTGLMVDAGREAMQRAPDLGGIVSANTAEVMDSYTAMLAAAPAAPQEDRNVWQQIIPEDAPQAEPKREPNEKQIADACLRYRHDFGLLDRYERDCIVNEAWRWADAFGIGGSDEQAEREPLSEDWIIDTANEIHAALPFDADEQAELLQIVRAVERAHGIGGSDDK